MNIIDLLLTQNRYSRVGLKTEDISGIVIHYVANPNTTAFANRNYYENLKSGKDAIYASIHYIIGQNGEIVRCVPENEIAYHAGNQKTDLTHIGIDCCYLDIKKEPNALTYNSLIELCADICHRYNLSEENIIRHYDVAGKKCPLFYVNNTDEWKELKSEVKDYLDNYADGFDAATEQQQLDENKETINKLSEKIEIDKDYWMKVLSGEINPNKMRLSKLFSKIVSVI